MISVVRGCGCPPTPSSPFSYNFSPPCTPVSKFSAAYTTPSECSSKILNRSRTTPRQFFDNSRSKSANFSKDEREKCSCPKPGHRNYDSMQGKCSPCCAGVFSDSKVISKIASGGKPYKEIEAIINDNRMVIRIQRESVGNEWDPPCDCLEDKRLGGGGCEVGSSRCGENVLFRKVDHFRESQSANCRTVEVYPNPEIISSEVREDVNERVNEKKEKSERPDTTRLVDLEENPNIFLLRIRKRSENSDRKNNIDLEFRTPRPWINRPKPKPTTGTPEPSPVPETGVKKKSPKGKKGAGKKKKGK